MFLRLFLVPNLMGIRHKLWKNLGNLHGALMEPNTIYFLEKISYGFSVDRFLAMFQMHRPSFWHLVKELQGPANQGYGGC